MTGLDFCSGEVSPPVHRGLRPEWSGVIRENLSTRPFARTERVLDLVVLNPIRCVVVLYRPEEILEIC